MANIFSEIFPTTVAPRHSAAAGRSDGGHRPTGRHVVI